MRYECVMGGSLYSRVLEAWLIGMYALFRNYITP